MRKPPVRSILAQGPVRRGASRERAGQSEIGHQGRRRKIKGADWPAMSGAQVSDWSIGLGHKRERGDLLEIVFLHFAKEIFDDKLTRLRTTVSQLYGCRAVPAIGPIAKNDLVQV